MPGYAQSYASASFVSDLAHALLTAASALFPTMTNTYVSMGKPAADGCDQLVVWVDSFHMIHPRRQTALGGGGMSEDKGGLEPAGGLPAIDVYVQLLRCGVPVPAGDMAPALPSASEMDVHATSMLTDGWTLYHGLINAWQAGTLFGSLVPAHHTQFTAMKPYGPEGGISGWTLPLKVSLF